MGTFKVTRFSILLQAILTLAACKSVHNNSNVIDFSTFTPLSGTEIMTDAETLYPQGILAVKDGLILQDTDNTYLLAYYQSTSTTVPQYFAGKGQGPYEFINIRQIYYNPLDENLFLYDSQRNTANMFRIDGDSIITDADTRIYCITLGNIRGGEVMPLGNEVVAGCVTDGKMFAIIDSLGNLKKSFGVYPGDNTGIDNPILFQMTNQSKIIVNPQGTRMMTAGLYSDWMAFYDMTSADPKLIKEYFSHDVIARATEDNPGGYSFRPDDNDIYAYYSLAATPDYVYALYDGTTFGEHRNKVKRPRSVLKFDWDGNLVAGYSIDDRLLVIAVSDDDSTLYALVPNAEREITIRQYDLKP